VHVDLAELGNDLFGLVSLLWYDGPSVCSSHNIRIDHFKGGGSDALLAFVLNGLFVVGIVEALNHDQVAIAGALSHLDGVVRRQYLWGYNGAHKYNRHRTDTFTRELGGQFRYHPPKASPAARTFGIRLGLRF
jgi:hypothetical protein